MIDRDCPTTSEPRPGLLGAPVDVAETTAVTPFNDADFLDRRLAEGDVACLLMEPALTNIGRTSPSRCRSQSASRPASPR